MRIYIYDKYSGALYGPTPISELDKIHAEIEQIPDSKAAELVLVAEKRFETQTYCIIKAD